VPPFFWGGLARLSDYVKAVQLKKPPLVKFWQGVYNSARFRHRPVSPVSAGKSSPAGKSSLAGKFIRRAKVIPVSAKAVTPNPG
jgi:hypothetical protein